MVLIIKVLKREPIYDIELQENFGEIIKVDKTGVYISTKDGAIKLVTVKPEGKGEMFARDWYNGVKNVV